MLGWAAFTRMVNFGDSLSDVGSYNVGVVKAQGGGHYSINGVGATGLPRINWKHLPKSVRVHLEYRLKDRSLTEDDVVRLAH